MTDADVRGSLEFVLEGVYRQVKPIPHRWLKVYAQNQDGAAAIVVRGTFVLDLEIQDGVGFMVRSASDGHSDYLLIASRHDGLPAMFIKLAEYVLGSAASALDEGDAVQRTLQALKEFRLFSLAGNGERLSEAALRGLYAELHVIEELLETGVAPKRVLEAWRGPFAREGLGTFDFVFPNGARIEVKSIREGSTKVRVGNLDQLKPDSGYCDLVVVPLERVDPSMSVADPVSLKLQTLEDLFRADSLACLFQWRRALFAAGLDRDDDWYARWCFSVGAIRKFGVGEGFPSLQQSSIPAGIENVSYSLNLTSITPWEHDSDYSFGRFAG